MSKILAQGMITLTQLYEGAQVILTPATVLIPCDSEENPKSNAYINASTNVKAFLGTMDITSGITLGELEYSDSTVRASKTETRVSITAITTRTGYVDIPVSATINGETIDLGKHRFSFVKQIDGQTGQPGAPGDPGFGYTLNIKGGTRGIAYAANGTNPEPNTSSQFSVELLKNGVKVSNPASISWTCGGNLSGVSSVATFTPAIKSTYASGSSYVKVSVKEFAASLAVEETIPIICTKHADGLDWINEWNNQYVQVGTEKIITPKIFAGTKNSANELTGVAIGRDVLGGNANKVIGIVGYKKNTPVFSLDQDANFFVSSSGSAGDIKNGTNNAKGLYFDGNNLYISGKVRISGGSTIGESNTLVEDVISNSNLGAQANNKLDNLQIGGRNLQRNTEFKNDLSHWNAGAEYSRNTSKKFDGSNTVYFTRTGLAADKVTFLFSGNTAIQIEVGQTVTASANFFTDNVSSIDGGKAFIGIWFYDAGGSSIASSRTPIPFVNGKWVKCSHTATAPANTVYCAIVIGTNRNGSYYIGKPMFEKGNKATDWSPAPEDVATDITNAKNEAINSANNTLTTTIANYYTKEQTNSQIDVAKEAINLGVSSTYETKANVETKVNNAINNIQIGGRNLISPAKVQAYTQYNTVKPNNTNGWTITKKETAFSVAIKQSDFTPEVGKTYTFSGYATVNGQPVSEGFFENNRLNTYLQPADRIVVNNGYFEVVQKWDASSVWILHCVLAGVTNGVVVDFSNLMLEEGNKASAYTKNPNDVDEVIGSKANSSDVYKKTEVYTKAETNSQINVAKNDITLAVSNTIETTVNNAVNNIQIGGRNIIGKDINNISKWSLNSPERFSISNVGYDNTLIYKTTGSGWETAISDGIAVVPNKEYVLSFEYEVFNKYSYLSGETFRVEVLSERIIGNSSKHKAIAFHTIENVVTPRKRVYITFTPITSTIYLMINGGYIADGLQNLKFSFNKFQLEKGNKATDWTPAPEDVYTKEETNSQINMAKDSITNTVSQNYVTKNDATNTYATKSSLTQTTNSITAKFETSGGYNLLRNSGFKNGNSYWSVWHHNNPTGGVFEHVLSSSTWGYPDASVEAAQIRLSNQSNIEYGIAQSFNTTIGKQYTLTFQYAGHRVSGANAIIRGANGSWLAYKDFIPTDFVGGSDNVNKWGTYSLTFTATATTHTLNIVITTAQENGFLWIAKPQIVEGAMTLPYTPHPSEIYEGSTIIDATGVTVNNGALRVKNNSGSTVLSGDSNGNLVLAGNITSNATIKGGTITGGTLKSTNGDMLFDMNNGYMLLYNNGTKIAQTNKNSISGTNIYGVSNGAEYGNYASLSAKIRSSAANYQMMITASGCDLSDANLKKGVTLGYTFHSNNWHFKLGSSTELCWRQNNSNHDSFITEGSDGMLRLFGDNGMYLGYRNGDSNTFVIAIRENGSHTYPKSLSVFDDGVRPATDNNGYSLEISAPLNMKGQSINQCSNIKTLGLEFIEPIAFNRDGEDKTRTLKATKSTQNIVEFIGSAAIKNGEAIVDLPSDVSFKNYVVLLTPIGLDRKVSIVEKNDDNFKIVGNDGIVDYVIKFESMDYASYISKSISEDNTDIIVRSEEDKPKEIFIEN